MTISFGFPIKIKEEESMEWTRKKLFVMYVLWMPIIAMAFTYYNLRPVGDTIGLIAENIGAVALFGILYSYLRSVLERKKEKRIEVNLKRKKE